ncbi:hypothetical protein SCP_0503370 [Sparassis crispa]|uniref:Uncharacterized protein n=1 Tax=Sparassis crispa TaxID=139825 RepID=A0A401GMA7_9APHY|nr:hypothetical protein SCP_0503370 [Sparassis crispa]GBE83289.1 hypothetical protein SCP_0503370 [Sparassis crispa]
MPSALLLECNGIADALVKAIRNPVRLQWDIDRYCDSLSIQPTGQNEVLEAELERKWPPPFGESEIRIDQPATLVDMHAHLGLDTSKSVDTRPPDEDAPSDQGPTPSNSSQ